MAPRGQALPQATTESAREARKSFFCELCQKGYARMNEFEAHEGSYDHQHRKRLKEMRQLTKDPNAAAKARERANEESGLKSINLASLSGASTSTSSTAAQPGKKKPVFKSTLQPHNAAILASQSSSNLATGQGLGESAGLADDDPSGAIANEWSNEAYDPKFMTGCDKPGCEVCKGRALVDVESIVIPWQLGWEMPGVAMTHGLRGADARMDVEMGGVS